MTIKISNSTNLCKKWTREESGIEKHKQFYIFHFILEIEL